MKIVAEIQEINCAKTIEKKIRNLQTRVYYPGKKNLDSTNLLYINPGDLIAIHEFKNKPIRRLVKPEIAIFMGLELSLDITIKTFIIKNSKRQFGFNEFHANLIESIKCIYVI